MSLTIGAITEQEPGSIGLSIEARTNNPDGTATVQIRNWGTRALDFVGRYQIGTWEAIELLTVDGMHHARPEDGRIEIEIKHVIVATFSASGFRSRLDHVKITVTGSQQ
ncbi:MAG: hypothetical protein ACR2GY_14635 [Phycisphaerales bacterium]